MKSIYRFVRSSVSTLAASMLCLTPAWADDTDIFFGTNSKLDVYPNVLLMIDTSGSMGWNTIPATDYKRMEHLKQALRILINDLNDVNVGLMRFTNPGGPVLYPVRYIDEELTTGGNVSVTAAISENEDDALETDELLSPAVLHNDTGKLTLVKMYKAGMKTARNVMNWSSNDASQNTTTGEVNRSSGTLEFLGTNERNIGLRFGNVVVPKEATIKNARVVLFGRGSGANNTDTVEVTVVGEKNDADRSWTGGASSDISNRVKDALGTDNTVQWDITEPVVSAQPMESADLSPIVQEIVNNASWSGSGSVEENDISLVMKPREDTTATGERRFYSRNGSFQYQPQIVVDYLDPSESDTQTDANLGLRFQEVDVPKGATIIAAYISFTVAGRATGVFDVDIYGENSANPSAYTSGAEISSRTYHSSAVNWYDTADFRYGQRIQTPDIATIVQQQVNHADWCGGGSLAFALNGISGELQLWARDGNAAESARLHVVYDHDSVPVGSSCIKKTLTRRVNESLGDVEEWNDGTDRVNSTSTILHLNNSVNTYVGLNFRNIRIPKGATVRHAHIEVSAARNQNQTSVVDVAIQDTAAPAAFDEGNPVGTVKGRTYRTPTVEWTLSGNRSEDYVYTSPDLKSMVQTMLGDPSWASGNSMLFRLDATGGAGDVQIKSFDNSPGESPKLVIEFEDDGSNPSRLVRDELLRQVEALPTTGGTPVQDTYYEAASYLMGKPVKWGNTRRWQNHARVSHPDSMVPGTFTVNRSPLCPDYDLNNQNCRSENITGAGGNVPTYKSPIVDQCQKNTHLIVLTDGEANSAHSTALYPPLMGGTACVNDPSGGVALTSGEKCVKTMAHYLKTTDLSSSLAGNQVVTTHTVGFNHSSQWLRDIATEGGGTFNEASTASDLVKQINQIVVDALKDDTTFVAPVATVNQFNRLNHLDQIYFALFRPDEHPRWPGNVKRYKLGTDNQIVDQNDAAAIDPATGFFSDSAQSYWSGSADGGAVTSGGAASHVSAHASRNVYTYHSASSSKDLTHTANALTTSNTVLTKAMFGVSAYTDAEFSELINWIRGQDTQDEDGDSVVTENRYALGDPLHSRPVAITYGTTSGVPDVELFFGTNGGGLHSVRGDTGAERFVFIPEETFGIQKDLKKNPSRWPHAYGMDGRIAAWVNDNGNNGIDLADTSDFVRIYMGMRRGGNAYYGLDVTNRDSPKLLWKINGGAGAFTELGQTWAEPVKAKVKINSTVKDVIIFTGGYDPSHDTAEVRRADTVGRAIFMVDAETGALLWSGGLTSAGTWNESFADMKYSFPSAVTAGDIDSDGLIDSMFAADTGGQVWRFDIYNGNNAADLVKGGVIADLGPASSTATVANSRRFFHTPSIALRRGPNGAELAIAVGSGFRPSPLKELAQNRMYMIRQTSVFSPPGTYTKLTESDLYDASANRLGTLTDLAALAAERATFASKKGWYFDIPHAGEKVLSSPLITQNKIAFTTYQPKSSAVSCSAAAGVSRVYQVALYDAQPTNPGWSITDPEDPTKKTDPRSTELETTSITDEPVVICTEGNGCNTFIGTESPLDPISVDNRILKTYWRKEE